MGDLYNVRCLPTGPCVCIFMALTHHYAVGCIMNRQTVDTPWHGLSARSGVY